MLLLPQDKSNGAPSPSTTTYYIVGLRARSVSSCHLAACPQTPPFCFCSETLIYFFCFFLPSCRAHTFVCFDVLRTMLFTAHVCDATYHIVFTIIIVLCPTCIHPTHLSCSACSSCTAHSLTKTTPAACVTVHHTATTGRNGAPHDY